MTRPPAACVMPSIRPSTWAGTPATMRVGGAPSRSGQACRTRSWLPPMPPLVTTTAWAVSSKSPTSSRLLGRPRSTSSGARTRPRTPVTVPTVRTSSSTRWRKAKVTRPLATAARTRRANGSTSPGPVPQVMWKRGTELPCPSARPSPRSAQPTTGKSRWPCSCSHARFSPAAKWRYASAHLRGQKSSSRSNWAEPIQSCVASSRLSLMPIRRCSGLSTRKRPPKLQKAWPPRDCSPSWSTSTTRLPRSASSAVATSPARPAPTTTTSASMVRACHHSSTFWRGPGRVRPSADPDGSLAGGSVDALAEQVRVTAVTGVLLDEVDEDLAQVDRVRRVEADEVERLRVGHEGVAVGRLLAPASPGLRDDGVLADGTGEVGVAVVGPAIEVGRVLPGHDAPPPRLLDLGQVAHESEQRHRRRRHRASRELLGRQTGALQLQREAVVHEVVEQGRALVPEE